MKYLILLASLLFSACSSSPELNTSTPLFDGKTLNGWTALPGGNWEAKDGMIIGTQDKSEKRHGMLISNKQYSDFEISLKYKALQGNSGFYFRVHKVDHVVSVKGFQAEIASDANGQGGLYETLGRAWVVKPTKEEISKFYKPNEWNEMTVTAIGRHITVSVNGVQTAELFNDPGQTEGFFGLQLHGSQDMNVMFKDIYIKDLSVQTDIGESFLTAKIHDKSVPYPPIREALSEDLLQDHSVAPKNAIVLFDGKGTDKWQKNSWIVENELLESNKGNLVTKDSFGSGRYHLEWCVTDPDSPGNSGVYIQSLYEVQIFNSYKNRTPIYADGQAAAIYGQYPPAFNVCRYPGHWEFYDIFFKAAEFDAAGKLSKKASMTVYHNGIRIHHNAELTGPTNHYKRDPYTNVASKLPLLLQDHGNKIRFRNIWFQPE